MLFTLGNIVTVLVVIAILIAYRQLDSKNRSLEKVKKFADKVRGDLDVFVEAKADELRNLSIELDVHQKTGKEILRRISAIEENLNTRAGDIDELHTRIVEYDNALGDLVNMTGKVDENLKRLHDESEFVDGVAKRLKESSARMGQLEKDIPGLVEDFAARNTEYLEGLSTQVLEGSDEKVQTILGEVGAAEERVKDFAEYLTRLEARRDDIEQETFQNISTRFSELTAETEEAKKRMSEAFEIELREVIEREEVNGRVVVDDIERMHEGLSKAVTDTKSVMNENLMSFQDRMNRLDEEYQTALRDAAERGRSLEDEIFITLKDRVEGRARTVESNLAETLAETREKIEESRKELVRVFGETRSEITVWQATLNKSLDDTTNELVGKFGAFQHGLEHRMSSVLEETGQNAEQRQKELEEFIDTTRANILELEHGIQSRVSELETAIDEKEGEFRERLQQSEESARGLAERVSSELEGKIHTFEQGIDDRMSGVESKVGDFEGEVSYRFEKIEGISTEIDSLESNLKEGMDLVTSRIHGDLNDFAKTMAGLREKEKSVADKEFDEIRQTMSAIEKELEGLKSRAYENVSEKLQVFEDDFFSDLKNRNGAMTQRLEEWQIDMSTRLDDIAATQATKRAELERTYTDGLKAKLSELQNRIFGQYERYEDQVDGFQSRLNDRMTTSENSIQGFEENLQEQFASSEGQSRERFERRFSDFTSQIDDQVGQYTREVGGTLKSLNDDVSMNRNELMTILDTARSDVTVWQAKVLQQLKESEMTVNEDLSGFKTDVSDTISILKENFSAQREEILITSQNEREAMRAQLSELAARVAETGDTLDRRGSEALASFDEKYREYVAEIGSREASIKKEIDTSTKALRNLVGETREKTDQLQGKLFGRIEDAYKVLSVNVQEIEKRQKDFIGQTKIFERADSLKESLEGGISTLKEEIDRVGSQGKEIYDAEKKFFQIKKLADETSSKLDRFMSEKRRIEGMEQDFKKLIVISQAVDHKLEQVTSSDDALQQIQARISELESIEQETQSKYERLESKRSILDSTMEGVDRNFSRLEDLGKDVKTMESQFAAFPSQIDLIEKRLEHLSMNKDDADRAIDQMTKLEPLVVDMEGRLESLQKAREWLARTETRLEDINRQASEQVKLLGSILKENGGSGKKGKGAPPMGVREMVTRLASQGWSVQQISQATKLSVGEVELILELIPKA